MPTMKNTVYFNLKYIDEGKTEKERIERMYEICDVNLKTLLDYVFNPNIKWVLNENIEYKPSRDEPSVLLYAFYKEIPKLAIFLNIGTYKDVPVKKKTQIFISMLENMHNDDAKLLMECKDKKLPFKNLTAALIKKAYPKGFPSKW